MEKILIASMALLMVSLGTCFYVQNSDFFHLKREEKRTNNDNEPLDEKDQKDQEEGTPLVPTTFDNVYISQEAGFHMEYPEEVTIEEKASGYTSFYLSGPTQREDTEFYDGISIRIQQEELEEGITLEKQAQTLAEQDSELGEVTEEVQEVTLNGVQGYTYSSQTIGSEITSYLLEYPDSNQYLHVINGTADPENQGYEKTAQQMLETIELL